MQILKLNSRRLVLVMIVSSILLCRCVVDTFDMRVRIVNNTAETIFVVLSTTKSLSSHPIAIDPIKGDTLWNDMRWVNPLDSINSIPPSEGSWGAYINRKCQDSTLTVFVFDKSMLKSASRDSLAIKQLYSERFTYKVKDLEKLNWRVECK